MATSRVDRKQPPFLALPGELRNMIYRVVLENMYEDAIHIRPIKEVKRLSVLSECRGLSQTCRTTRDEFLPLWLLLRRMEGPLDLLPKYFEDFIYPQGAFQAISAMRIVESKGSLPRQGIDILPTLQLMSAIPVPWVQIDHHEQSEYYEYYGNYIHYGHLKPSDNPRSFLALTARLAREYDKFKSAVEAGYIKGVWIALKPNTNPFMQHAYRFVKVKFMLSDELGLWRGCRKDLPAVLETIPDLEIWKKHQNIYIWAFVGCSNTPRLWPLEG